MAAIIGNGIANKTNIDPSANKKSNAKGNKANLHDQLVCRQNRPAARDNDHAKRAVNHSSILRQLANFHQSVRRRQTRSTSVDHRYALFRCTAALNRGHLHQWYLTTGRCPNQQGFNICFGGAFCFRSAQANRPRDGHVAAELLQHQNALRSC